MEFVLILHACLLLLLLSLGLFAIDVLNNLFAGGEYGHPQHRAVHDMVVKVATELALLDKVWCMHPVRWRRNWYREEGDEPNREDREHPAQETPHVQQPKARGGRKTHVEVNQIQVLENSYPSQKHAWSWLIDLETVFLPYAEHVANKTCVGCRLPMSPNRKELDPAAVFRWFCLSWCVE